MMVIFRRSLSGSTLLRLWFLLAMVGMWTIPVRAQGTAATPQSSQTSTETHAAPPEETAEAPQPEVDPDTADISLTATVRAREVRFDASPQVHVEFSGQPERITENTTVRTNLPDKVQPGVVYRNVEVRLKIASVFADIDRIVAEATGLSPQTAPQIPLAAPLAPTVGTERRP